MAKLSVEVMILLFGTLTLWLGFLKIAERALLVQTLARWLSPLFARPMAWRVLDVLVGLTMAWIAFGLAGYLVTRRRARRG